MQPKNLGWKFAFVALVVALSLYAVWAKGLRWGLDLKGGYILTFQVQVEKGESRDLVNQVIEVLKARVDPQGLASLEWRPEEGNRIEVRMPMGTEASRLGREAFEAAMERVEEGNIRRSQLARLERGAATVEELAKGDPARTAALNKLVAAQKTLAEADKKLADLRARGASDDALAAAQAAVDDARAAQNDAMLDVLATNVPTDRLRATLALHVTAAEAKVLPRERLRERTARYDQQLAALRQQQPARVAEIDAAEKVYRSWAERRRPLDDPADLKRLVARAGVLEFRIAPILPGAQSGDRLSEADRARYLDKLANEGPMAGRSANEPYQWFAVREGQERVNPNLLTDRYAGRRYVLLENRKAYAMLQRSGSPPWSLTSGPGSDDLGRPAISFHLDLRGGKLMGDLTSANRGNFMAILLDDEVYSAPVIQATIYTDGIITGSFTRKEVSEMVKTLNTGALRARVDPDPVSERAIAPSMGKDNREAGLRAAVYGLIFVAAFMLVYYIYAGGIADVALLLNLILVLGAMSFIEAVFTLPGIAGLILTIGMAVDANVLIFERLREEQTKTQSMRMAIRNAYSNAASAILDGNATTLITCLILGWVGTEEIRGFAITLGLGVMFSLFTSLIVTRWVFQFLLQIGAIKDRIRMLSLVGTPSIDWMKKRRVFWTVSALLIAAGLAALTAQGKDVLGLEFRSGTKAVFTLRTGQTIPDAAGKQVLPDRAVVENDIATEARQITDRLTPETEAKIAELSPKVAPAEADVARLKKELAAAEAAYEQIPDKTGDADKAASDAVREARSRLEIAESDLKKLREELVGLRQRVRDLARLTVTTKVETIVDRRKGAEALSQFDTNDDKVIDLSEWQAGKGEVAVFRAVDANGDGKLTQAELNERLPERSYQVSTAVADVELLREVVRATFGDALQSSSGVKYKLLTDGKAPVLDVTLEAGAKGRTRVTAALTQKVPPEMQDQFMDMDDGVMLVLTDVSSPQTAAEVKARLREMRAQPDFAELQFNRFEVIGLEAAPGGDGYTSLAVLVASPTIRYGSNPTEWGEFADREEGLLSQAMAREATTESLAQFDPAIAARAAGKAGVAFVLSWAAIIAYLWLRFSSLRWGLAAVICLIHDVLIAVGMVALSAYIAASPIGRWLLVDTPFQIDMAVMAAFLTVIGYSVNDTIVVFDRIRENRGRLMTVDEPTINRSINQTLSRTLLTTFTTLIAVVTMYIAGGPGIRAFTYALMVGILVGTYSSIAIASPLLLGFKHAIVGQLARAGKAGVRT